MNTELVGGLGFFILGLAVDHSLFQGLTINQYNLFLTDYLSKRTQVYAGVGLQRASGPGARAAQFGYQPSSTGSHCWLAPPPYAHRWTGALSAVETSATSTT